MVFLFGRKRAYQMILSLDFLFSFSGFVYVCFMSSLCVISMLCIRFTWLIMTRTVPVTACFVNLVGKLSVSMYHGSCDICFALHYCDSLDPPFDYTPGTVLRISVLFLLANPVFVHMSLHKFPILFCLCQVRPLS